jgi:hypothetical protein
MRNFPVLSSEKASRAEDQGAAARAWIGGAQARALIAGIQSRERPEQLVPLPQTL